MSTLRCSLVSPEREVFSGEAEFVVVPGYDDGDVGFLPGHAAYVGKLGCGVMRVRRPGGSEQSFAVFEGFVEVSDNVVTVLASNAELAEEITEERLQRDRDEIAGLPSKTAVQYEEKQLRMRQLKARLAIRKG